MYIDYYDPIPTKVKGTFGVVAKGDAWQVAEIVTRQGYWITHEGIHGSFERAARAAVAAYMKWGVKPLGAPHV